MNPATLEILKFAMDAGRAVRLVGAEKIYASKSIFLKITHIEGEMVLVRPKQPDIKGVWTHYSNIMILVEP